MSYREDHDAALARADALERELAEKDDELARLRSALAARDALAAPDVSRTPDERESWLSAYLDDARANPRPPSPPPPVTDERFQFGPVDVSRPAPRASLSGVVLAAAIAFVIIAFLAVATDASRRGRSQSSVDLSPPAAPSYAEPDHGALERRAVERPEIEIDPATEPCDEVSCVLDSYKAACCARWKPRGAPAMPSEQ